MQKWQGGARKPLSRSRNIALVKNIKTEKIPGVELPLVGFSAERGWRNMDLPWRCPPPSPEPPTAPALFSPCPAVCKASSRLSGSVPGTGSLCSTAPGVCWGNQSWRLIPQKSSWTRKPAPGLFPGCRNLRRADMDYTPGKCFPYAFICKVTGFFYRHCALVFQTGLDFSLYYQ